MGTSLTRGVGKLLWLSAVRIGLTVFLSVSDRRVSIILKLYRNCFKHRGCPSLRAAPVIPHKYPLLLLEIEITEACSQEQVDHHCGPNQRISDSGEFIE